MWLLVIVLTAIEKEGIMTIKTYLSFTILLFLLAITITPVYSASTLPNEAVFNWVEYKFADLFPKSQTVKSELTHDGVHYDLRSWSGAWGTRYLGITDAGEIIGLGDYTDGVLLSFGYIDEWEDAIVADMGWMSDLINDDTYYVIWYNSDSSVKTQEVWKLSNNGDNYIAEIATTKYDTDGNLISGPETIYNDVVLNEDGTLTATLDSYSLIMTLVSKSDTSLKVDFADSNSDAWYDYFYFLQPDSWLIDVVANYNQTECSGTADDSTPVEVDGGLVSSDRIHSEENGDPTYHVAYTRRTAQNTVVSMDYMLHEPPEGSPQALLVLIGGGNFDMGITGDEISGEVTHAGANFLVRSAHLFAQHGYRVVTVDRPTDWEDWTNEYSSSVDRYRISTKHAVDLAAVLEDANGADDLPVVLLGTSRGAISAVDKHFLSEAISISSPLTSGQIFPVGVDVGYGQVLPEDVNLPVHVMWHKSDGCVYTKPEDSLALLDAFPFVSGDELEGGFRDELEDRPCNWPDHHGFMGIESCTVNTIATWLDTLSFSYSHPIAEVENSTLSSPIEPGTRIEIDLSNVTASAAGGALTFGLPRDTTSLAGTVALSGSVVTYTPANGVGGTRDTFVYTVEEAGGGRASNKVVVEIK